ncbi:tetratricopeptide repeat protein [Odoribacter sp. AF15-53]|uniref:tetratricopeptide repeat protein n=1 Tax=Odoribacter sp. AF15-53 TaxID=2292236 RepID=UPI000E4F9CF1|nr:tetratricopeptide repeat protein [Odoribacter sp. AF15-53]
MRQNVIVACLGVMVLLLLSSCRRGEKMRTEELCRELESSVMLSPVFDSLVNEAMHLPKFFRSKVLLTAGTRYSMKREQLCRAKVYLQEAFRIAPRDLKRSVALELARLYGSLVLRDDCTEEAIRFMSTVRSRIVFTREDEAEFYYLKARFFKSINMERAFTAVGQALSLYKGLSDVKGQIETYCLKASLHGVLEEYEEQYACYEEAYRLLRRSRTKNQVKPFYEQMAASLKKLGRHEEALLWYEEVLKELPDSSGFGRYGVQVSEAYSGLGYHEKARDVLKLGLKNETRGGLRNVLLCRIADSFMREGLRDSALVYLKTAIDFYEGYAKVNNLKIPRVMLVNYLNYGRCLWEDGQRDSAIVYLNEAGNKKAESRESQLAQAQVLEQLCEYYEEQGDRQAFCEVFYRRDSIMEEYQSVYDDGRYRRVLERYKNQKLLREIEEMNRKQEETNWWLVLSLIMTVGVIASVLVYTWISWGKLKEHNHKR